MALGKSFRDFVLRKTHTATRNAMEALAHNTVRELPTLQGVEQSTKPESRENRVYTMPPIPPADLRKGYTIGNRMEYRAIAMDLEPGRLKNGPGTAEQDWYTTLMEGGELIRINKEAAKAAFQEVFK